MNFISQRNIILLSYSPNVAATNTLYYCVREKSHFKLVIVRSPFEHSLDIFLAGLSIDIGASCAWKD